MRRFTAVDMGKENGDCTCKLYGHYGKHGVMVIDKIDYIEKEVRKEVAIDYEGQWKKFRAANGHCYLVHNIGSCVKPTHTLANAMDTWIRNVILNRENLMEEFVKERMKTNIDGGNINRHNVDIIYKGGLCGRVNVNKEEFAKWIKNRKEEK